MKVFSLDQSQIKQVIAQTQYYIELANRQLELDLSMIDVCFDLKGRASGMFVVRHHRQYIRYNEIIFSEYFEDNLCNTVGHEVAHYVVHSKYGIRSVKPHGNEWKKVMALFKLKPEVTSSYNVSELPLHRQNNFSYSCICTTHQLSTTRHNRVQRRTAVYKCRKCKQPLRWNSSGCDN